MVGVIHIGDLKYCPYLKKYEDIFDKNKTAYEVLFWNRSSITYGSEKYIPYNKYSELKKNKILKVWDFLQFRSWVIRKLRERNYDKLIILSTLSGMILAEKLISTYSEKYIFDIRDYCYEKFLPFYMIEKSIVYHSAFTTISSEGFREFLPRKYPYVLSHNIAECNSLPYRRLMAEDKAKINVVWLGMVRYFEQQKEIICKLSRDGRFCLSFYGEGTELEKFQSYVKENKLENVSFYGAYSNSDKELLLESADIINNCYAVNIETRYAVSNKFYDGIFYHIPQLVEPETFKAQLTEKYRVGIALNPKEEHFADKLYAYYMQINEREFNYACETAVGVFLKEEAYSRRRIQEFLKQ